MCGAMEYPRLEQQCFASSTYKECVPLCCIVTVLESFYIANLLKSVISVKGQETGSSMHEEGTNYGDVLSQVQK